MGSNVVTVVVLYDTTAWADGYVTTLVDHAWTVA